MRSTSKSVADAGLHRRLATSGFRFTPQRRHVYDVLMAQRDHPTVEEVFLRSKERMPDISMATVYNCLDALVQCGLVRHVNHERSATRYCPNMKEHSHFHCEDCGRIFDIDFSGDVAASPRGVIIPKGFKVRHFEVSIRGVCRTCAAHPAPGN